LQISNETFLSKGIVLPVDEAEQQKLAEFLTNQIELISAQTRKVDTLKTFKKGLMQQFFTWSKILNYERSPVCRFEFLAAHLRQELQNVQEPKSSFCSTPTMAPVRHDCLWHLKTSARMRGTGHALFQCLYRRFVSLG